MKSRLQDAVQRGGCNESEFPAGGDGHRCCFRGMSGYGGRGPKFRHEVRHRYGQRAAARIIKIYKAEVEQRSGGKIKVEVYPQSQLGPIPRQIEGLQLGTIEGFIGPADFYVGVDKRYGVSLITYVPELSLFLTRLHD